MSASSPSFEPVRYHSSVYQDVRGALRLLSPRNRLALAGLVGVNVVTSLLDLLGILLIGLAVLGLAAQTSGATATDTGLTGLLPFESDSPAGLAVLALIALVVLAAKSLVGILLTGKTLKLLSRAEVEAATGITDRLFSLAAVELEARPPQKTGYALAMGVHAAVVGVLGGAALVVADAALLSLLVVAVLFVDPLLSIVAVALFGSLAVLLQKVLGPRVLASSRDVALAHHEALRKVQEASLTTRELQLAGNLPTAIAELTNWYVIGARAGARSMLLLQIPKYVYELALLIGSAGMGLIAFRTMTAAEAAAVIAVFLAAGSRVMPALLRIQGNLLGMRSLAGLAETALEVNASLESPHESVNAHTAGEVRSSSGAFVPVVRLKNASARYPGSNSMAVQNVDLDCLPGTTTALVGPTGAGKSSLVNLSMGMLPVCSGTVTISGHSPQKSQARWPGAIAYVPQSVPIVSGTLASNVALGVPDHEVDFDRIWGLFEGLRLDAWASSLPAGLHSHLGERGHQLSGGEAQRIGLARALYTDPKLIFLDEATSQLDAATESAITDTLSRLGPHVTSVIVAHRLATVKRADLVVYLSEGRILASGSFDTVRSQVPAFDKQASLLGL